MSDSASARPRGLLLPGKLLSLGIADPNRVWLAGEVIYREIVEGCRLDDDRWLRLPEFSRSRVFQELQARYLIPHELNGVWLRPRIIRPFTACYRWTKQMLKDAALHVIEMNLFLQDHPDNQGRWMALDCHIYNVAFWHSQPRYIDVGSFTDQWNRAGWGIETIMKFINSHSVMSSLGITAIKVGSGLEEARDFMSRHEVHEDQGEWDSYGRDDDLINSKPVDAEQELILGWARHLKPHSICDVGCNSGTFSRLFAREGISVVALDSAAGPLTRNYLAARRLNLPISCVNIRVPEVLREVERPEWSSFQCEVCFLSSVVHHLARANMSWEQQADLWSLLGSRHLWAEWIDRADSCLQAWLGERSASCPSPLPSWYRRDLWMKSIMDKGWWLDQEILNPRSKTRSWCHFRRD